jgi:type I restriction enzyme S subunit
VDAPNDSDVFVIDTVKKITSVAVANSSTKILRAGTTIISARGTVGKCALLGTDMAMNQSCYGVQGADDIGDVFTYYTVREYVADLQQRGHGSVFNTITRDTFKTISVPFCGQELTQYFDKSVSPKLERIRSNLTQLETLTKLRDTLLPKLISGELRVSEVEKLT